MASNTDFGDNRRWDIRKDLKNISVLPWEIILPPFSKQSYLICENFILSTRTHIHFKHCFTGNLLSDLSFCQQPQLYGKTLDKKWQPMSNMNHITFGISNTPQTH